MIRRPFRPAASAIAMALALVACSGDDTAAPDDEPTTTTTIGEVDDPADIEAVAVSLLVTTDEINAATDGSFVEQPFDPDRGSAPPCGPSPDDTVAPVVHVGSASASESLQLAFEEQIRVYDTEGDATEAFDLGVEALICDAGETSPVGEITPPQDVTAEVGGTRAIAVAVTAEELEGVLVLVEYSDALVVFQFSGTIGAADAASAPAPLELAAYGMQKIVDALG